MDNFIGQLKSSTSELHKALESTGLSKSIMDGNVKKETYVDYLQRIFLMHDDMEKKIFPALTSIIKDIDQRIKTKTVEKDLAILNSSPSLHEQHFLEREKYLNTNFNIGLMYVTEGSTLGGLYILKNIRQSLGVEIPGYFLNVYGEKTGSMWKGFLAQLEEYQQSLTDEARTEIIAGANYGFERARHIFEENVVA